jgi:hypothetical protein
MIDSQQARKAVVRYAVGPTMLMGSGNYFDFLSPETSSVTPEDIAYGLAFTPRFRGQTVSQITGKRVFYGVGEHILRGLDIIAPEYALDWLHHEDGEVPWGDIISPQKEFVPAFDHNEKRSYRAIAAGLFGASRVPPLEIKRIDLIMMTTERRDLMPPTAEQWHRIEGIEALPERIVPMDIYDVAEQLVARIREMMPEGVH